MNEVIYEANAIKAMRESKGMSQNEAATKSGLDQSYLSKVERGLVIPSLTAVASLASVYGIRVKDFVDKCFTDSEED